MFTLVKLLKAQYSLQSKFWRPSIHFSQNSEDPVFTSAEDPVFTSVKLLSSSINFRQTSEDPVNVTYHQHHPMRTQYAHYTVLLVSKYTVVRRCVYTVYYTVLYRVLCIRPPVSAKANPKHVVNCVLNRGFMFTTNNIFSRHTVNNKLNFKHKMFITNSIS